MFYSIEIFLFYEQDNIGFYYNKITSSLFHLRIWFLILQTGKNGCDQNYFNQNYLNFVVPGKYR